MFIVATFYGDDTFTHIVDTNSLDSELKNEVESAMAKANGFANFSGDDYYCDIQDGAVAPATFPLTISGMIDVYLE